MRIERAVLRTEKQPMDWEKIIANNIYESLYVHMYIKNSKNQQQYDKQYTIKKVGKRSGQFTKEKNRRQMSI